MELADYRKMNQVRARVDAIVKDPATAAALKPWYRQFCKRPCFHDEYLQTYNRPNVTLVDTDGQGVERLTERGVVANGSEYELDCLIFATGFEVGTVLHAPRRLRHRRPRRRDAVGALVATACAPCTGCTTHGFPNCFFLGFTQTAITISVPQALNEQAKHVAYMVTRGARRAAPRRSSRRPRPRRPMCNEVRSLARLGERFYTECTPGYYNSEGAVGNRGGFFSDMYGAGPLRFFEVLEEWRADGRLEGLDLR